MNMCRVMAKYTPKHEPLLQVRTPEAKPKDLFPTAALAPEAPFDELPELTSIGFTKTKKGWVVYKYVSQGKKILEEEIVFGPGGHVEAVEKAKMAFARQWLLPKDA